jgi:anaerobic C4-dicarboxylate transporter
MPALAEIGVLALAVMLGVALAFSFGVQQRLQTRARGGDREVPLAKRLTAAALSMALLFCIVILAKEMNALVPKNTTLLSGYAALFITLAVRWLSNRTVETDARKSGARGSP